MKEFVRLEDGNVLHYHSIRLSTGFPPVEENAFIRDVPTFEVEIICVRNLSHRIIVVHCVVLVTAFEFSS